MNLRKYLYMLLGIIRQFSILANWSSGRPFGATAGTSLRYLEECERKRSSKTSFVRISRVGVGAHSELDLINNRKWGRPNHLHILHDIWNHCYRVIANHLWNRESQRLNRLIVHCPTILRLRVPNHSYHDAVSIVR